MQKNKYKASIEENSNILEKRLESLIAHNSNPYLPKDIPDDLDTFYHNMGYFMNQKTNKPIERLAEHQIQCWEDRQASKYRLYLKSQKIGLSTLLLLEDIHIALTWGKGKEILVISQSKDKAQDHLQDIRKMLRDSPTYKDYLIEDSKSKNLLSDEKTKVEVVYIRNPDIPTAPTKIIARGITSPGSLISYKKVCHVHMSDVTLADMTIERYQEAFSGVFSRLANTEGTMVIECPPRGPSGPVFDIVDEDDTLKDDGIAVEIEEGKAVTAAQGFLVRRYTYRVGIDSGMITPEFIEREKKRLGVLFGMYYEASFYTSDKTWFRQEHVSQISGEATYMYGVF